MLAIFFIKLSFKRDVAIVSEIAGTTRDVLETHLNIDGLPVIISDTAGIRESKDEIEKKGIKLALKSAEKADLNIVIIEPKSVDFTGFLKDLVNEKAIFVLNKSDLGIQNINPSLKKLNLIPISLKNEKNIEELISAIKIKLKDKFITSDDILITRERHRHHLEQCVQNLEKFESKNNLEDFDKAAEDLRLASRHLGIIVGKVDVEEILGSIFNDFCISK
jgi:small GTP-binding protein domain